jgi:hypothetical protein
MANSKPAARINVDDFRERSETVPVKAILYDPENVKNKPLAIFISFATRSQSERDGL